MGKKRKKKAIVLFLGLAVMTLASNNLNAQYDGNRGLFGRGIVTESTNRDGAVSLGGTTEENPNSSVILGGATEENPTPVGSGIAIFVAAGAGYVLQKRKEKTK